MNLKLSLVGKMEPHPLEGWGWQCAQPLGVGQSCGLFEAGESFIFAGIHRKDGIQPCYVQRFLNLFARADQFQLPPLVPDGGEGTRQAPQAGAVAVADLL